MCEVECRPKCPWFKSQLNVFFNPVYGNASSKFIKQKYIFLVSFAYFCRCKSLLVFPFRCLNSILSIFISIFFHFNTFLFHQCAHPSVFPSSYLGIYLSMFLSRYLPYYVPIQVSTFLCSYLGIYLSTFLSRYLPFYVPIQVSALQCSYLSIF